MASTYSTSLRIQLIGTGEQSGVWGSTTNSNLGTIIEQAITGVQSIALSGTTYTLTSLNGVADQARNAVLVFTGSLGAICTVSAPAVNKMYVIYNNTTGGFGVTITTGSGSTITIPNGATYLVYSDGTNFYNGSSYVATSVAITGGTINGTTIGATTPSTGAFTTLNANTSLALSTASGTASQLTLIQTAYRQYKLGMKASDGTFYITDVDGAADRLSINTSGVVNIPGSLTLGTALAVAQGGTGVTTSTGSGSNVLNTSPTLVTPLLGTPTSGTLTNCTGLPVSSGISGLGANVATFLATPSSANLAAAVTDETGTGSLVFGTGPTITLANGTGLPVSTGISGLGTGVATFLGTPTSANLASTVTDETGSGSLVFATSPTLVTPVLGTPASGTLTNCTGLPVSTGISGFGSNVATFLATPTSANLAAALTDETGTGANVFATSPTLVTPLLGTPASGTLTNCTGLPVSSGISGFGTGIATFLATPSSANLASAVSDETGTGSLVFSTSPTLVTPILGTPTSATLTNATGLPISTGVSGLGTGIATFLGTPSSANLAAAVTDETGSGSLVFGTSPLLQNPAFTSETYSATVTLTAGTNAQGQGAFTSDFIVVTTTAANPSGVTLPTATTGRRIIVVNKGTNPINVYPATGASIDAIATNSPISLPVNGWMEFNASSTTQWYSTANITISSTSAVSSFSAGSTGFTPSSATTGAVTLAGTLGTANGGTNLTSFTSGGALYATSTSALTTGTLPVLSGGTGVTTSTGSGDNVLSTSPTLVTPALGTPSAIVLTNATGTSNNLNAGIGVNQTWTDVKTSPGRVSGTTYTNSTGKAIQVFVSVTSTTNGNGNNNTSVATVGSVTIATINTAESSGFYSLPSIHSFIVPDGQTYKITNTAGTGNTMTITSWTELR